MGNWSVRKNGSALARIVKEIKVNWELSLLALPGLLIVFVFAYIPMPGIILAFKRFSSIKGIFGSPWVGFYNFKFLFMSDTIARITVNTVVMNLLFILTSAIFAIVLALLLFEVAKPSLIKVYQTIMIFPNFLSWVVVSFMFYTIMSSQFGMLNMLLKALGLNTVDWYSSPQYWPFILIVTNLWKGGGVGCLLYFATLMGIDMELFEAARIDGATKLQMIRYISLPLLIPMATILIIMNIGNIIRADFGMFYNLTMNIPALYSTTDVIDTFVFRALRSLGDQGMAAAAGLYQSVVGFILIVAANSAVKKINPENSLF